ncbi:MAG: hypothetical protein LBI13_00790 [Streptococcaceae bacterium]|jgi:hypothetical protein|nr:hypothetical protein [Streptococcaceae bacterium]
MDDHSRGLLRQFSNNYRDILSDLALGVRDYVIQTLDENGEASYEPPEQLIRRVVRYESLSGYKK